MDEFFSAAINWLYLNYPSIFISFGVFAAILYVIKQIKETFVDKGNESESFGEKIKNFIIFWKKNNKQYEQKNVIYSEEERKIAIDKLKIHNFFQEINNIKNIKIPNMNFGNRRKNEILREVIRIYVDTIEEYVFNAIDNYQLDKLKTNELNDLFSKMIDKATNEIYFKIRNLLGNDMYNLIIEDQKRGFKIENSIFRDVFVNGILNMSVQHMSVYGYDNYERVTDILTSMYISLQVIVKNFEKVFKNFNGELDIYLK